MAAALIRFPAGFSNTDLDIEVEGDGRIYGIVLRQLDPPEDQAPSEGVLIGMDRCTRRGCDGGNGHPFGAGFGGAAGGIWRAYVIADGTPVTVTLRLKGVKGKRVLQPTDTVGHALRSLEPRVDIGLESNIYSVGEFESLANDPDFGSFQMWRQGGGHFASAYKECYYYSLLPMPPEETAFVPGCPTSGGADENRVIPGDGGNGGPWFRFSAFGEIAGLGGWYSTTAAAERMGATVFWMSYIEE